MIREEEDEPVKEPFISILSRKGKEKVISPFASGNEAENINTEMEATEPKVTRTPTKTKRLLDIIATITGKWYAAEKVAPTTSRQTPNKYILTNPKGPNKGKWGTSGGVTTSETPMQKMTRSIQPWDAAPTGTPLTSPLLRKKKTLFATSPQGSLKDRLRSSSKKQ